MTANTLRQYVVTLYQHEDLDDFYDDMETPGGNLYIPDRAVDIAKRRPLSRNTIYWLTENEAAQIRKDSRVQAVELTLEEQNIKIEPVWTQTSSFFKGSPYSNPDLAGNDKNWGLLRIAQGTDVFRHGWDDIKRTTATISTNLDGNNVDIVIVDGHIRPSHAEFSVNSDGSGGSRLQQINWLAYSTAIGKTLPATPGIPALPLSYDYSSYYNTSYGDHGAMVAAIAAGNTQGWARKANIYNISPYNESGMVEAEDAMDYILYWHTVIKTVNPLTGVKNPTVVNLSWGTYRYVNVLDITSIDYKGITYSGPWSNTGNAIRTYQQLGLGYKGAKQYFLSSGDRNYYIKISDPIAAWQADTENLISAGIHVVVAAGNEGLVQDVSGGTSYNNKISTTSIPGGVYYNRKSGPASVNAISVGSIDSSSYAPGVDDYSNRGPAVDIMAPGSGIVTAINRTTSIPESVADSRGLNGDRIIVGHGTSFAAPQIAGVLATILSYAGHLVLTPSYAKTFIAGVARVNQLVDYEAPYDLAGTPNRYAFYREYFITTTTTLNPAVTSSTTTSTTTSTSTTSTSTSTSSTSTTTLYYPPAQIITIPLRCYPVPEPGRFNIVGNVAWYSFTITSNLTIVVDTLLSNPINDTHIALFDDLGEIVAENDDTAIQDLSYLEAPITAGRYYIAIGLYETDFNQRFRAESKSILPNVGVCFTVYDKANPIVDTTSTTTTSTSTSTTTTSTSTTSTSTTTYAPYPTPPVIPPTFTLLRTWCDNFTLWGLYINQFGETYSVVIAYNSIDCGYFVPSTSTSTTSTTTTFYPAATWDSTVTRLSILVNRRPFSKIPIEEPNYTWMLVRGFLPTNVTISNIGVISGSAIIGDTEVVIGKPAYVFDFGLIANTPSGPSFRQYSISVITNGLFIPNKFLPLNIVFANKTYSYTITSQYLPEPTISKFWKLKWGILPPNTSFTNFGTLSVTAKYDIRPFRRSEFLPDNFVDTSTNNDTTWNAWLKTFLDRPHDYDYQFVVELSDNNNNVDISHTIRVIQIQAPIYESWFQLNTGSIIVDSSRYYFIVLSTEHDAADWITENNLGEIANGSISKKSIKANNKSGNQLFFQIEPNTYSRIPQGIKLQSEGLLVGRPSFRTYEDDPASLPVNDVYNFTIRSFTLDQKSFSTRRFSLKVLSVNQIPSDNLYIRAFPTIEERQKFSDILNDSSIFPTDQIFRPNDPWFGLRRDIFIDFAMGLNKKPPQYYSQVIQDNHYNKSFNFGPVQTACVLDANKEIEYEIVYLTIVDYKLGRSLTNNISEAQQKIVDLTSTRTYLYETKPENDLWYYSEQTQTKHFTLAENDIYNMKNAIANIGYTGDAGNMLPEWALSEQPSPDGSKNAPIGFIPIVVIAYVKPGCANNIKVKLDSIDFNFSKFEFDRYQLETWLTEYYNPETQSFTLGQPTTLDNNLTTFDQDSTRLIENHEQYVEQHGSDKYIKFPKTGVFR